MRLGLVRATASHSRRLLASSPSVPSVPVPRSAPAVLRMPHTSASPQHLRSSNAREIKDLLTEARSAQENVQCDETQPLLKDSKGGIPAAPFTAAIQSKRDPARILPQCIAHRGYKALWPENTMEATVAAVEIGAHAIETDLHLSADGVVVLSHDATLQRCYGSPHKISECSWEHLSKLRTLREPHAAMPRLQDLLEWLATSANEQIWVLLDIKIDDNAQELMKAIAETLAKVESSVPWEQRLVLGCWNASFITAARQALPSFPLVHISWSLLYSRHFLPIPNLGFNILQLMLLGPLGSWFIKDIKKANRPLFAWTVNAERWMNWCIRKNIAKQKSTRSSASSKTAVSPNNRKTQTQVQGVRLIDGVITDDPLLFLKVCSRWEDELDGQVPPKSYSAWFRGLGVNLRDVWRVSWRQVVFKGYFFYYWWSTGRLDLLKDRRSLP